VIQLLPAPPTPRPARRSLQGMGHRIEIREFLASRRVRLTPERAGLPTSGANRRLPGLRREEVALLAGVSVDYYTQMERGNLGGVSDNILDAVVGALQLDEAERAHLSTWPAPPTPRRVPGHAPAPQRVRPSVQRLLDAMTGAPAVDWDKTANDPVAILRGEAGRNPDGQRLSDLVGGLSTRGEAFRTQWGAHNVRLHRSGRKQLHRPVCRRPRVGYEALALAAGPSLTMITYTAEPASASQDALDFLASWAATLSRTETAQAPTNPDRRSLRPPGPQVTGARWNSTQSGQAPKARPSGSPATSGSTSSPPATVG
jgi:transcriptional regulator with XRE-family HTH domain